jgi:hypothetical protein
VEVAVRRNSGDQYLPHVTNRCTIIDMRYKIWILVFTALSGLGGVACILQWLEIKPKDVSGWHVSLTPPHWVWLIGALLLFVFSIGLSAYGHGC